MMMAPLRLAATTAPMALLLLLLSCLDRADVLASKGPNQQSWSLRAGLVRRTHGGVLRLAFAAPPAATTTTAPPTGSYRARGAGGPERTSRGTGGPWPSTKPFVLRGVLESADDHDENDSNRGVATGRDPGAHPRHSASAVAVAQHSVGSRRQAVGWLAAGAVSTVAASSPAWAADEPGAIPPGQMDVDNFLRTGMVPNPMGVSGQAGKSRPETGVLLREGSDVRRDAKSGDVLAELLLKPSTALGSNELTPVVATFQSPWPLATGTVFDVECRDPKTGDGVFLQVTPPLPASVTTAASLSDSLLLEQLVSPTGRFSFYGAPTDVRVRRSGDASVGGFGENYKVLDVSFSIISQSTQTELPRQARIVATIPTGTAQAVMLVASTGALRWKKIEPDVANIVQSFKAVPAPPTQLKVRAKERR